MRHHTTFRQLEIFQSIARLGSFTRASEELYLTQPTVSMQMKKLAENVGAPLIEQVGKKIRLTPDGQQLAVDSIQGGNRSCAHFLIQMRDSRTKYAP